MFFEPDIILVVHDRLEKKMRRRQIGEVVIRREKVWSLAYADDIVGVFQQIIHMTHIIHMTV